MKPSSFKLEQAKQPEYLTVTVTNHTKVKIGPGFNICDVFTGFESHWVIIDQVQSNVHPDSLREILQRFGEVRNIKFYPKASKIATVKVQFDSIAGATKAVAILDGYMLLGKKLAVHFPLSNSKSGSGIWDDTCVQLSWHLPSKMGYAGYPSLELAQKAIKSACGAFLHGLPITAEMFDGIPSVGEYTVRFRGLPSTTSDMDLARFQAPEAIVFGKPNYFSLDHAVKCIRRLLEKAGEVISFEMVLPRKVDNMVQALVQFTSHTEATEACSMLNNKQQHFIGEGKIFSNHIKTISYTLPSNIYDRLASDIRYLMETSQTDTLNSRISIFNQRKRNSPSYAVSIKLSGSTEKDIGRIKSCLEKILKGEVVSIEEKAVWDPYFETPLGVSYIHELENLNPSVKITKSIGRRTITLFGPEEERNIVRLAILERVRHLTEKKIHVIELNGAVIGPFVGKYLLELQQEIGPENVMFDRRNRTMVIRGSDKAYEAAQKAIFLAKRSIVRTSRIHQRSGECPVCFDEPVHGIMLQCGHTWCRPCLSHYLVTAVEVKPFPLLCLGEEGNCKNPLPIHLSRDILTANDFNALVQAAFVSYVYSRPHEFYFCPTPDCPEIYRNTLKASSVLQCPSCLMRIVPRCNNENHSGTPYEDDNELFNQWAVAHGIKNCPECKAPIERTEGCNHITCIRCHAHICWVCLATFLQGVGIYDHMKTVHGGFYSVCGFTWLFLYSV